VTRARPALSALSALCARTTHVAHLTRSLLALCALWTACGGAAAAQFVAPEGSRYHNGASLALQDEGDGADALAALRRALAADAPDTVASVFAGLRADAREQLVALGPRVDAPALEVAARRLAASGDSAALAAVLAVERAAIAQALLSHDLPSLLDRATRGLALESCPQAALAAARMVFEEGRWWEACSLARRAGGLDGAAQLAAAAQARLQAASGASPAGRPVAGHWALQRAIGLSIDPDPNGGLPLVTDGRDGELLFADSRVLFPFSRATGKGTLKPFEILPQLLGEGGLELPGVGQHALARWGSRLIVPVNAIHISRFNSREESRRNPGQPRAGRLAALDFGDGELAVAWTAEPPATDGDSQASTALGPPLAVGGRVFCLVFRVGLTTDVSLLAVSAEDGRLLFETPLVNAAQIRRYASRLADTRAEDLDKRGDDSALAERDGIVYACTGHGVFAAVDGLTGHVRHTFRYDRIVSEDPESYDPAFLFETGTWDGEPVRLWPAEPLPPAERPRGPAAGAADPEPGRPGPERVVIAPGDSRFLYMLAREPGPAGQLILDDPIERLDRLHVAGLLPDPQGRPSPAVLCTRRRTGQGGLALLGPDGHVLAATPMLPAERAEEGVQIIGRPLLAGARALVPTLKGLLSFAVGDLGAPPELVPGVPGDSPAVQAVFAVRDGLVTLSPQPPASKPGRSYWSIQWYAPVP